MSNKFKDEFEVILSNGKAYDIEVTGNNVQDEDKYFIKLDEVVIKDEYGDPIDEDHEDFEELKELAENREYTPEFHDTDVSFYDLDANRVSEYKEYYNASDEY